MKTLITMLITFALVYLVIMVLVWLMQDRLIFFPQPLAYQVPVHENLEEVFITTRGGNQLHGWLRKAPAADPQKLIIYFGGNAEEVSHMLAAAPGYAGWAYLLMNYPGYGNSEGRSGKTSFYDAALAIYDYALTRQDIDTAGIVVMGRSIGTGSAVFLAGHRKVRAVVLISPFESLGAVARSSMWFLPVGLLLRHNFKPERYAKNITAPLLAFYGTRDNIIPPRHSINLTQSWKGEHILIPLQGYGHNDIFASQQLWGEVEVFLNKIQD
jgi:uncharacterized protein